MKILHLITTHYSINIRNKYNNLRSNELIETLLEFDGINNKNGFNFVGKNAIKLYANITNLSDGSLGLSIPNTKTAIQLKYKYFTQIKNYERVTDENGEILLSFVNDWQLFDNDYAMI